MDSRSSLDKSPLVVSGAGVKYGLDAMTYMVEHHQLGLLSSGF